MSRLNDPRSQIVTPVSDNGSPIKPCGDGTIAPNGEYASTGWANRITPPTTSVVPPPYRAIKLPSPGAPCSGGKLVEAFFFPPSTPKCEIRNPKQIQNPKFQCHKPFCLGHLNLVHWNLFRISCFGFPTIPD